MYAMFKVNLVILLARGYEADYLHRRKCRSSIEGALAFYPLRERNAMAAITRVDHAFELSSYRDQHFRVNLICIYLFINYVKQYIVST